MLEEQQYETEWEGLRLVIEQRPSHWQIFVYDVEACEILYTGAQNELEEAKREAITAAATSRFGPEHGLNIEILSEMLLWEPVPA